MTRVVALMAALLLPARAEAQRAGSSPVARSANVERAIVVVTRPTVIAYLVVPEGAVDTSSDVAVLADDWNVAMATVGDSLAAHGIGFALVTESQLRVRTAGRRDVVLALDEEPAAGYVFAGPGAAPCVRHGAAQLDEVLRAARALVRRALTTEERTRARCVMRR